MSEPQGESTRLRATIDRLRGEVEGQRRAMRTRAVIEQAKGILIERFSCTTDEAFSHLVQLSQDSNRRVVDIAADLLATVAPPDTDEDGPVAGLPQPAPVGRAPAAAGPRAGGRSVAGDFAARYHLAASALGSAEAPDELAALLTEAALAPLGVGAVALTLLEPDGALRLVASHGVPAHQLSQWQRIPPSMSLPMTDAVRSGTIVWARRSEFAARYPDLKGEDLVPGETVCALPLRTGERLIGAMKLGWPGDFHADRPAERYLSALGRLCAAQLLRVLNPSKEEAGAPLPTGEPWFRAVLDALLDPVLILNAVRETEGKVTDLRVEHANAATIDLAGRTGQDITGRLLSELYPGMVSSGTFQHLLDVAATGVPYQGEAEQYVEVVGGAVHGSTMTLHATPFLDGVLVSWRIHDEQELREHQLAQAQRLAGIGTWQWGVSAGHLDCSPEVFRLLGRPERATLGTLGLAEAEAAVAPADRAAVHLLAERLLAGHASATLEFRIVRGDGVTRTVRAIAESVPGQRDGELLAVRGVVQDISAWRRTERALTDTRAQLAEQVRQTAVEHRAVRALQHALMDVPGGPPPSNLEVAAHYLPAESDGRVGGDWYDALTLPDDTVLIAVGDVSGHGLRAAAGMAQLRDALRGMAFTGAQPDQMLQRLNEMLCHLGNEFIATAVCGRLDPEHRTLTWARAGHLPPLLVHDGAARYLDQPPGMLLGAHPGAVYRSTVLDLEPDDVVLLFTDGLVERRGESLDRGLERLLTAAAEYKVPNLRGHLDHILRRLKAPNPQDDTCIIGLQLT
ncbi:SpoIIE family protein phosphatase [Kitasatospora sp. RG8]|uniref:SpoIIE family protein phosphatase n=1 Tax=Kitasatospora sp. RG8 TaxID=2820815 RepID=UPI001ADEC7E5|nr:SpoIIE family protein phosphatase [Kitasatospora sp. RG8]MBP0450632.1 SpoIIE family protein phosphatase [Kitasatospora sp. RG8]